MYTITYKTKAGCKKQESYIDKEYILFMFKMLLNAKDLSSVTISDGFTGEVLYDWSNGVFHVIDGTIV